MRTKVFKNLEDYKIFVKLNPGTLINGVTQEFLDDFYESSLEDCDSDNATNELCFNCYNCKECHRCMEMWCSEYCYNCSECTNCKNCNDCYDCSECIGCAYCCECVKCENCSKTFECESCYLCKGISNSSNRAFIKHIVLDKDVIVFNSLSNFVGNYKCYLSDVLE